MARLILSWLLFCFSQNLFGQGVLVCQKGYIVGLEAEYLEGNLYCGEATDNVDNIRVYITEKNGFIYAQSNLLYSTSHPIKIYENKQHLIKSPLYALDFILAKTRYKNETISIGRNTIFILDEKVLRGRFKHSDFPGVSKIKFICPDQKIRDGKIESIGNKLEPLAKLNDNLYARVLDNHFNEILNKLHHSNDLTFDNIKVLSLIGNTDTKNIIDDVCRDKLIYFDFSSEQTLRDLLNKNNDKTIIILGHVHNGNLVTIAGGEEKFRIPISTIKEWQDENSLNILYLGCNAALEEEVPGAVSEFNSIDIVRRIKTTKTTKTNQEFLDSLCFRTTEFLVYNSIFRTVKKTTVKMSEVSFSENGTYPYDRSPIGKVIWTTYTKLFPKIKR